jgi:hypothetical protein
MHYRQHCHHHHYHHSVILPIKIFKELLDFNDMLWKKVFSEDRQVCAIAI